MYDFLTSAMDIFRGNVFLFAFLISMYFNIMFMKHCINKENK